MKWLKYALWFGLSIALLLLCVLLATGSSQPYSDEEITGHAKRLNEAAAVQIPHFFLMSDALRAEHLELLQKVEAGNALDATESQTYRKIFQHTLFEGQSFLGRFDSELTVLQNVEMKHLNNVGSSGIEGHHDHHDVSARLNYADVERAMSQLEAASGIFGFWQRIRAMNLAQKSLADIISHMGVAPHTISVAYQKPQRVWREQQISDTFESMMRAYKASQFDLVNGAEYWKNIDKATALYARLVAQVQQRLWRKTAWWERRIAGRFLDYQTLAPQISADISFRR